MEIMYCQFLKDFNAIVVQLLCIYSYCIVITIYESKNICSFKNKKNKKMSLACLLFYSIYTKIYVNLNLILIIPFFKKR